MGLRETILGYQDGESKLVYVPEWGEKVTVRSLTAGERDRYELSHEKWRDAGTVRSRLVVMSCYDEDGNRLFKDEDADALAKKSASAVGRLFEIARKLSGMTEEDVEDLEKN